MNFSSSPRHHDSEETAPLLDRTVVAAFLDHVPDLVYFKDHASRFIAVSRSKARRHGLEPPDLIGKSDADFFSAEHAQAARADEEHIIATGESVVGKTERITWPDGRESWAMSSKLPLRDAEGAIIGTFGLSRDVTAAHRVQQELETTQRNLVDASRMAGMAEVATGVLHNVGNVLTSLNVSASVIATGVQQSKAGVLEKISALLREHAGNLRAFLNDDPRGRRVPELLESIARHSLDERDRLLREIAWLQENVDHIKEIVTMQQTYATMAGLVEPLDPVVLMDDAMRMNAGALTRHSVECVRKFAPVPRILAEKGKTLQILVNLIRNAKYAADKGRASGRMITLHIAPAGMDRVRLIVEDNGIGIPLENLEKIFTRGFTTRADGHGFGLHSSASVAREMNGTLIAHSEGPGHGARFTLELPAAPAPGQA